MQAEPYKRCSRCEVEKPLSGFVKNKRCRDGRAGWCKQCFAAYNRGRYQRTRHVVRDSDLRSRFGISLEQYESMVAAQGGVCAICGGAEPRAGASLAVDHSEATGAVRGILCSRCNIALGQMHDDPARLRAAARYLEEHAGRSGNARGLPSRRVDATCSDCGTTVTPRALRCKSCAAAERERRRAVKAASPS